MSDWMAQAACRDMDTNVFFPSGPEFEKRAQAVAVCNTCPVQAQCLAHALDTPEDNGVWGGVPERHRVTMTGRKRPRRGPDPITTGDLRCAQPSRSKYSSGKCRCPGCRDASAVYQRQRRQRRRQAVTA